MAKMGNGYGSEFHLLRYLGRHRTLLDKGVSDLIGAERVAWLDFPIAAGRAQKDGEWKGVDFLNPEDQARKQFHTFFPRKGNPPNWDAIARVKIKGAEEWLLVEAKANLGELKSSTNAKNNGGLSIIKKSVAAVKSDLGVAEDRDWLHGYYQYCNRIAMLDFLKKHGTPARMLFIYFCGDKNGRGYAGPKDRRGWQKAIDKRREHVGLSDNHPLSDRVYELFLDVRPKK